MTERQYRVIGWSAAFVAGLLVWAAAGALVVAIWLGVWP